jgi:hypothetical protein
MAAVRIRLHTVPRGPYAAYQYRFDLEVRGSSTGRWHSLPCLIDTATEFTTVPRAVLPTALTIPRLPPTDQLPKLGQDYLGSLFYRFPSRYCDSTRISNLEFHCEQCRVSNQHMHRVHLALRDILAHFEVTVDNVAHHLVLTLLPRTTGFPVAGP